MKHDFEDPEDFLMDDPRHPHPSGWREIAVCVVCAFLLLAAAIWIGGA